MILERFYLNCLVRRFEEIPHDRPVVVPCAGGYRSILAATLRERAGMAASEMAGGFAAWESAHAA